MKLLRLSWHVASILILLVFAACALSQSQDEREPTSPQQRNTQPQESHTQNEPQDLDPARATNSGIEGPTDTPEADRDQSHWDQFVENALTDPIVGLTVALLILAGVQYCAYRKELRDTQVVERASLSLTSLRLDRPATFHQPLWTITIGLANHGHTTATVTDARVILRKSTALPPTPTYAVKPSTRCPPLLAANESSNWRELIHVEDVEDALTSLNNPGARHWVYGRILFDDVFGGHHEYRFGREWLPDEPALSHKETEARFGFPEIAAYNVARPLPGSKWWSKEKQQSYGERREDDS